MATVMVRFYQCDHRIVKNFQAELIKTYTNSALLDITDSQAFTVQEIIDLNHRIVVPIKRITEQRESRK
jgi:predicted protein tyrosine phosphatase